MSPVKEPRRGAPAAQSLAEPQVGNYFVSAYPPFSCWTPERVRDFRRALRRPGDDGRPLGLYVHVPFCIERCSYCYYLSHDDRLGQAADYLQALLREARTYAAMPAVAGRRPAFVYFGGGTPSLLSESRSATLLEGLQSAFDWSAVRETTFECAPRSVTESKLRRLKGGGVTRLSLGVQALDDRVLRASGRVHLAADAERAYAAIRRVGFDTVNLDLIAGLPEETADSFFDGLQRVIALAPDSVTIYQLEIPHNTPLYRRLLRGGPAPALPGWDVKRARLGEAFARLEGAGYAVSSAYAAIREPARHRFLYQELQYRGADLVGLGVSSFSYLSGVHQQNLAALDPYLSRLAAGRLPLWRAYALSDDERLVRQVVLQLKLGGIETDFFSRRFGVDVLERFAAPLGCLEERGWLRRDGGALRLTRDGLLRVDRLIPEFYRAEHRGLRYS
jgi:oxygen-independent coproporphyrinogen-3 oxidase